MFEKSDFSSLDLSEFSGNPLGTRDVQIPLTAVHGDRQLGTDGHVFFFCRIELSVSKSTKT